MWTHEDRQSESLEKSESCKAQLRPSLVLVFEFRTFRSTYQPINGGDGGGDDVYYLQHTLTVRIPGP